MRRSDAPGHLAGWLFADLLIILFLLASVDTLEVAASKDVPPQEETTTTTTTTTPPTTLPTEEERPPALSLEPRIVQVGTLSGPPISEQVTNALREQGVDDSSRVGFLIAFGGDSQYSERAVEQAVAVVADLQGSLPDQFGDAVDRTYWGGGAFGTVKLEIFFFEDN